MCTMGFGFALPHSLSGRVAHNSKTAGTMVAV
jgi:hypothetical protein